MKNGEKMKDGLFKKISKEFSWPWVIGIFITLVLGVPALYAAFHEKTPLVEFEIVADPNVFDVHKPLKDLTVLFRGEDVQKAKQNLRIFTITVRNAGELDVVQTAYDQNMPWGISFVGATVIDEPRLIDSNSNYIKDNIKPRLTDESVVEFTKIIFEKNKYFTIEVQILHNVDVSPELKPLGKIAGLEQQRVTRTTEAGKTSFWRELLSGGPLVNVARAVLYIINILLVLATVVAFFLVKDKIRKEQLNKKKREYLAPILKRTDDMTGDVVRKIIDGFGLNENGLIYLLESLSNPIYLQKRKKEHEEATKLRAEMRENRKIETAPMAVDLIIRHLLKSETGLVNSDADNRLITDEKLLSALNDLIEYVKENPPPKEFFDGITLYGGN